MPAPRACSCPSATRVPNATWGAGRREAGGGPGRGGSLRPKPQRSTAGSPDHAASRRKPQGSPSMTREHSLKRSGDQPGAGTLRERPHLDWGLGGGGEGGRLSASVPLPPSRPKQCSFYNKYRPVSLKCRFRTCQQDAVNVWGLPTSFRLGGMCLPQNAAWTEPTGCLMREREQGVWETGKEGKWRTLPVSRGEGEGPSGECPECCDWQVLCTVLAPQE